MKKTLTFLMMITLCLCTLAQSTNSKGTTSTTSSKNKKIEVNGVTFELVYVEGGSFIMGCTDEQFDCDEDEFDEDGNLRQIYLDGYYIATTEVTQAQWEAVMGTTIFDQMEKYEYSRTFGAGINYPMYYVSWQEAMSFCQKLSNVTGETFILPTEAQWEYAARGGRNHDGNKYSGHNIIDLVAWYDDNSDWKTHPVASKRPNSLGLYDMSGNVWEMCYDWFYCWYLSNDTNNPAGSDYGRLRIQRGGSYTKIPRSCRVANRGCLYPYEVRMDTGFRIVMLPE